MRLGGRTGRRKEWIDEERQAGTKEGKVMKK